MHTLIHILIHLYIHTYIHKYTQTYIHARYHYYKQVSPASQWPEWVTSVPLLIYVALSIDSRRSKLRNKDIVVIVSMASCIVAGYMLQLPISKLWSSVILICAHMCIFSTILMIHRDHLKGKYRHYHYITFSTNVKNNNLSIFTFVLI